MSEPAAAIVGIYEYPGRLIPDRSVLQVKAYCAAQALADAGLNWSDVDGLYDAGEAGGGVGTLVLAEYFGLHPRVVNGTSTGGSSYEVLAGQAASDIQLGRTRVALITYGARQRSQSRRSFVMPRADLPHNQMEDPWGNTLIGTYALATRRHMYEFGTTSEQLAEIAVITRKHALRNPDAIAGLEALGIKNTGPITVEDVIGSRMIADPLHLLDCCLVSDGAGAIVIASRDVVPDTATPPAWILGSGTGIGYVENDGDIGVSAAADSGKRAFGQAAIQPDEVDIVMSYDSFTYTVLTALEDLGFCKKGDGGDFVSGGRLAFDSGSRPALNTDGGGLSSNHPGMRGIFLLIEATRQLRGASTSQVDGARLAVAHGNGGWLAGRHCAATVVLAA
jgi:acetyl-CoA C-acetyltransferase